MNNNKKINKQEVGINPLKSSTIKHIIIRYTKFFFLKINYNILRFFGVVLPIIQ